MKVREIVKQALPYSLLQVLCEIRGFVGNARIWTEVKENGKLRGQCAGDRCFILGNGPSLRDEALNNLKGEIVFTCNNIGKSSLLDGISSYAHFIMDARMVSGTGMTAEKMRIADNVRLLKRQSQSPMLFLGCGLREFALESGLEEEFETHYIYQSGYAYNVKYDPDLSRSIPALPTVVQTEILAALYMGFKEIYLLGCDCTGFLSLATVMSGDSSTQMSYAYETDEVDKRMLSHVITQSCTADELSFYAQIFRNYELMGSYCEAHGVKLMNLSSGGILNELPRARLEDVLPATSESGAR